MLSKSILDSMTKMEGPQPNASPKRPLNANIKMICDKAKAGYSDELTTNPFSRHFDRKKKKKRTEQKGR